MFSEIQEIIKVPNSGYGATETRIHCWWECKMESTTLEGSLVIAYTTKQAFIMRSSNHAPW